MLKGLLSIFIFCLCVLVFILLLIGGSVLRMVRNMRKTAQRMADEQARQHRSETGRQRQQYSRTQGGQSSGSQRAASAGDADAGYYDEPRTTQTATGETVIDIRQQRDSKKIFDSDDGEYVEFTEEK